MQSRKPTRSDVKRPKVLDMVERAMRKAQVISKDYLSWTMTNKEVVMMIEAAMKDEFTRDEYGRRIKAKYRQDQNAMTMFYQIANARTPHSERPTT